MGFCRAADRGRESCISVYSEQEGTDGKVWTQKQRIEMPAGSHMASFSLDTQCLAVAVQVKLDDLEWRQEIHVWETVTWTDLACFPVPQPDGFGRTRLDCLTWSLDGKMLFVAAREADCFGEKNHRVNAFSLQGESHHLTSVLTRGLPIPGRAWHLMPSLGIRRLLGC